MAPSSHWRIDGAAHAKAGRFELMPRLSGSGTYDHGSDRDEPIELAGSGGRDRVLSGLAPAPLADGGLVGYRAASHGGGADEDAVLGMRVGSCDGAARAYRPRLSPLPLPTLRQAIQRALRHAAEPDAVSVRRHRPRGALAPALQIGPAGSARDVCRARHRVQL